MYDLVSHLSGASKPEQCPWHLNQSSKVPVETGSTENRSNTGLGGPLAPSILHSTYEILQPHQLPVQVLGEQWLLHQQPLTCLSPSSPSAGDLTLQPSGQGLLSDVPHHHPVSNVSSRGVDTAVGAVWPPFWAALGERGESRARGAGAAAQHSTARAGMADRHPGAKWSGATGDRV